MRWIAGITTIFASGLVWASGLVGKFIGQDFQEFVQISTKVVIIVLPHVLTFGAGVIITLELFLRQDGLYLNHIEKKVNRVAGLELLQYYTKYSRVLGGTGYEFLGIFPMSIMTIIYLMYLLPFCGLWIYIIGLAIARYIFNNPDFPCWKEVMFIVVYIGEFVATVVLSIFGYRMTNKRFEHIINQDRVW